VADRRHPPPPPPTGCRGCRSSRELGGTRGGGTGSGQRGVGGRLKGLSVNESEVGVC
jgi:hypothetical protein